MPTCIGCISNGSCTGICRPKVTGASRKAIGRKIAEKGLEGYVHMECGHKSTREEQLGWAAWRPKGKDYFCTQHGHWVKKAPKPKRPEYPDTPPF